MIITKKRQFTKYQKLLVKSLAMDLKRSSELEMQTSNNYLRKIIQKTKDVLNNDRERMTEDALMYSTLFQNFALNKMG